MYMYLHMILHGYQWITLTSLSSKINTLKTVKIIVWSLCKLVFRQF